MLPFLRLSTKSGGAHAPSSALKPVQMFRIRHGAVKQHVFIHFSDSPNDLLCRRHRTQSILAFNFEAVGGRSSAEPLPKTRKPARRDARPTDYRPRDVTGEGEDFGELSRSRSRENERGCAHLELVRDRARNLLPRRGLGARTAKSAHALTLAEMESCQTHEIHKEPQIT